MKMHIYTHKILQTNYIFREHANVSVNNEYSTMPF